VRLVLLLLFLMCVGLPTRAQSSTSIAASRRQTVYVLRLAPGQDLRVELARFAKARRLRAAYIVTCVGSLNQAALRLANESDYSKFAGKFEIVSLVGTLTQDSIHLHLSASDNTGKTIGGHLGEGCEVYTTAEIVIGEAEDLLFARETDATFGYQELAVKRRTHTTRKKK
jgi:uncharacterized protein